MIFFYFSSFYLYLNYLWICNGFSKDFAHSFFAVLHNIGISSTCHGSRSSQKKDYYYRTVKSLDSLPNLAIKSQWSLNVHFSRIVSHTRIIHDLRFESYDGEKLQLQTDGLSLSFILYWTIIASIKKSMWPFIIGRLMVFQVASFMFCQYQLTENINNFHTS